MSEYPPVSVDLKYLTPRELKDILKVSGMSSDALENMGEQGPDALAAIAWVITRRDFPDVTYEEAWDIRIDLGLETDVDPTSASS